MEHFGLSHILQEPDKYNPDTLDLLIDDEAREYWLKTCERLVERNVNYALANTDDPTVEIRALKYKTCYVEALKELRVNPLAHGQLTIRLLLDINETCLRSQGFFDLWKLQKKFDNERALAVFSSRLAEIDAIPNDRQRWIELCRGVLAGEKYEDKLPDQTCLGSVLANLECNSINFDSGNMFDCGAQAVSAMLDCGLYGALQKIQTRPWLYDGLDKWLDKLETTVHRCAAIFVDNSGADIVLGILPFVRGLLLRGTSVILCANEWPALNDVTNVELEDILQQASLICPILSAALAMGDLVVRSSGQRGPCLDLRTISVGLSSEMKMRGVDLIILEGMGRAVHTNFKRVNTGFAVDSLKLAVVKNAWLAQRLGGPLFSVIFIYEDKPIQTKP